MGKQNKKVKEPMFIQAEELFTLHLCPVCGGYLGVSGAVATESGTRLNLSCLTEDCGYICDRDLI